GSLVMWRPPAASKKVRDGAGLLLGLGPSLGAKSWGQVLGPSLGARSWGQILGPDLGARSWGQILGPGLGARSGPEHIPPGVPRPAGAPVEAIDEGEPYTPKSIASSSLSLPASLTRSPKRRGSHARFASFRCQTGEDFNLLPGYVWWSRAAHP